ncbi:MAG: hypothetical protein M1826_006047 [Phylliscum demangeonii]|nr:MAG: hypothetical protein M1826_006047 [Phylliscum demangeonii]
MASPPPTISSITAVRLSGMLSQAAPPTTAPATTRTTVVPTTTTVPPTTSPPLAVIDVRDDDHIGGHIRTSQHVPSTRLMARDGQQMAQLVQELREVPVVVFHCSLSQQRGPAAAEVYVLEGGFRSWLALYGEDTTLTEGYDKEIWQD